MLHNFLLLNNDDLDPESDGNIDEEHAHSDEIETNDSKGAWREHISNQSFLKNSIKSMYLSLSVSVSI